MGLNQIRSIPQYKSISNKKSEIMIYKWEETLENHIYIWFIYCIYIYTITWKSGADIISEIISYTSQ